MIIRVIVFVLGSSAALIDAAPQKIAILSYGSLVNRSAHSVTGAHLSASPFEPTPIWFPISLSLLANSKRITAVIDTHGIPKQVWVAVSNFSSLGSAMQNLAAREGSHFLKNEKKYATSSLFYIRKSSANDSMQNNEYLLPQYDNWVIHDSANPRQQLPKALIGEIIEFAQQHQFDAAVWVSCPIVATTEHDFIRQLIDDPILLKNAQMYVRWLADGPQTELECAIVAGKQKLMSLMHGRK